MNGTIGRTLKRKVQKESMFKFYKVMSVQAWLHDSEIWMMLATNKQRLQTAEMIFLRSATGLLDEK
jgi:hypothetical protein